MMSCKYQYENIRGDPSDLDIREQIQIEAKHQTSKD